jgi:hypothetical protein
LVVGLAACFGAISLERLPEVVVEGVAGFADFTTAVRLMFGMVLFSCYVQTHFERLSGERDLVRRRWNESACRVHSI